MMDQENHFIHAGLKKVSLIILTLSSFLTPFGVSSVNIALPSIGKEFAMNAISLSWVPSAYILSSAALLVPFGRVADLYGRKKILWSGFGDAGNDANGWTDVQHGDCHAHFFHLYWKGSDCTATLCALFKECQNGFHGLRDPLFRRDLCILSQRKSPMRDDQMRLQG